MFESNKVFVPCELCDMQRNVQHFQSHHWGLDINDITSYGLSNIIVDHQLSGCNSNVSLLALTGPIYDI